jgi:hypothetical protein
LEEGLGREEELPVPVRVICILRRSDGSLVVCQDTDSDYSLTRVHRRRLARDRARPGAGISEI